MSAPTLDPDPCTFTVGGNAPVRVFVADVGVAPEGLKCPDFSPHQYFTAELVDSKSAAAMLMVSEPFLNTLMMSGRLPYTFSPLSGTLIRAGDIRNYLISRRFRQKRLLDEMAALSEE